MQSFYLQLDDLEELTFHNTTLSTNKWWVPRVVICGNCLYRRRAHTKMNGNFGLVFVYDSLADDAQVASVCIKVTDIESLCDGTDREYRVNGLCPNAGIGEVYSCAWTAQIDPDNLFFVKRYSAASKSIIGCCGTGKELKACKNATCVEEFCQQHADDLDFFLFHYTVMECYDGNILDLMRTFRGEDESKKKQNCCVETFTTCS